MKPNAGISRPQRPALRYHGGKWVLARWIIGHFPPHRIYTEAYGGGASVLLRKTQAYGEVYNDLDCEVVNFFRVLQDPGQAARLKELLEMTPFARAEFELSYEDTEDTIERARRLIIRSFMGFGSDASTSHRTGFRANSNRSGTTPAHDWVNYARAVPLLTARLQGVVIENRDAVAVLRQQDARETLHYLDPPYVHATRVRGARRKNYRFEMADDDHRALAKVLHGLEGMVVLSGYPSGLYNQLFCDWAMTERPARADGALPRTECLWLNPAAVAALPPKGLFEVAQ